MNRRSFIGAAVAAMGSIAGMLAIGKTKPKAELDPIYVCVDKTVNAMDFDAVFCDGREVDMAFEATTGRNGWVRHSVVVNEDGTEISPEKYLSPREGKIGVVYDRNLPPGSYERDRVTHGHIQLRVVKTSKLVG